MQLSLTGRLYVACFILSLISLSAFIANNMVLLLINHIGIIVIIWIRVVRPRVSTTKLEQSRRARILIPSFLYTSTLTCGLLLSGDDTWYFIAAALVIFLVTYRFPFFLKSGV